MDLLQEMLISIKETIIHRAKAVGCEEWGFKFDLKMLRAIGVSLYLLSI